MILTVIDTETTGLDKSMHEIIDIALISYVISENGERFVTNKFETKIKPQHIETASPVALEINHYKESEWVSAPSHRDVIPQVRNIIEKSDLLIGQNLIFDLRFIASASEKLYGEEDKIAFPPYIDTKAMADVLKKNGWIAKSGMDYLCEHYKISFEGKAHTALTDCERTMQVWDKLVKDCGDYELYSYESPYDPRYDR
tara:strand:+ start:78 stop:674 length:597 start_codon:yes stop_codon:yes gene_type:complete